MDKDKIIDYVMNSPQNTNRAVLEGMLEGISGGGDDSFAKLIDNSIVNAVIPDGATKVGEFKFSYCYNLKNVVIPNSVTFIGQGAFQNCGSLQSVDIGTKIDEIALDAFRYNSSLSVFVCRALTPPKLTDTSITGIKSDCVFYVPAQSVERYKTALYWSARADYIQAIE